MPGRSYFERRVEGPVGEHDVAVVETPGRGRTVEVDGDLYLHEDVSKEIAGFALRMLLLLTPLAAGTGLLVGRYLWP